MTIKHTELDKRVYDSELKDFLPSRIFDTHVHLFDTSTLVPGCTIPPKSYLASFGGAFTLEQCLEWTGALLPDMEFHLNSFGSPSYDSDLDASARYSGHISDNDRFFGMALVSPNEKIADIVGRVEKNRLIGYKPYLNFIDWKPSAEVTIDDMLPVEQMEYANEKGLAVTLHIPRPERLADPVNQKQMIDICNRYPQTKIIFAHIGRAYYLTNIIDQLDGIAACPNAYLDTAMVNHAGVLEYALRHFPRERILFGSDAPVAFLHGKSVEINNQYAYLMAEDVVIGSAIYDVEHVVAFTTFFYEQLRGIKQASTRAGLSQSEIEDLFFNNAHRLFTGVAQRNYGDRTTQSKGACS